MKENPLVNLYLNSRRGRRTLGRGEGKEVGGLVSELTDAFTVAPCSGRKFLD